MSSEPADFNTWGADMTQDVIAALVDQLLADTELSGAIIRSIAAQRPGRPSISAK